MTGKAELVLLSDEVWERTRANLDGLTDDEYFWEPAPGCWSVRRRSDGRWRIDLAAPPPDPAPLTTIAWRLWHLIDMYGEDRAPQWLDVPAQGTPIGLDAPDAAPPATAAEALEMLERAHDRWDAHLHLVTEEQLALPIGPVGEDYAERTRTSYVLHMLDEFIHHGAEISLLRDLWRWQPDRLDGGSARERAIRGDMTLLDEVDADQATELLDTAADNGRWELVLGLVERGARVRTDGRTPLHLAAGVGEVAVVQALLAHGGDPAGTDPVFEATPLQWARYLGQPATAAVLEDQAGSG
jgi:hypothetical protein